MQVTRIHLSSEWANLALLVGLQEVEKKQLGTKVIYYKRTLGNTREKRRRESETGSLETMWTLLYRLCLIMMTTLFYFFNPRD
ncbi:hypothetical protein GDO78_005615 [Eleutherodactylus coqui]|uniref:Uncharacterized protein n=1 Tax=Eleutherodactylus coqui TaxID=57060 RepID=A0A8J6FNA7_ELECQ|nr:hypothetical protein GDO78_005615 [Eleutherodactylus coqui]